MVLPILLHRADCTACSLSDQTLRSRGIATTPLHTNGHRRALLIIGNFPGIDEDKAGVHFVGEAGARLRNVYIKANDLQSYADIYATNAVRCPAYDGDEVKATHVKACRPHLHADLAELSTCYEEVVILVTGDRAGLSIFGVNQPLKSFPQGTKVTINDKYYRVFGTYNSGILLPQNDPSKLSAIRHHLALVRKYLRDGHLIERLHLDDCDWTATADPDASVTRLNIDIETYGCIEGQPNQTQFHPLKCLQWDGVAKDQLIQVIGLAWRGIDNELHGKLYRMSQPDEVAALRRVLSIPRILINQNIMFDIMMMRYALGWSDILNYQYHQLQGLEVLNFLENDQRAERSLKNLAVVLGITNYFNDEIQLARGDRYTSQDDVRLHKYCVKDCLASLLCAELLEEMIVDGYGEATDKWSASSKAYYSDLLWELIRHGENGASFDVEQLTVIHNSIGQQATTLIDTCKQQGLTLKGKGSDASLRSALTDAFEVAIAAADWEGRRELKRSIRLTKSGKFPTSKDVVNYLLGFVPAGIPRMKLESIREYRKLSKITGSYSGPLLGMEKSKPAPKKPRVVKVVKPAKTSKRKKSDKASALINGIAYPTYYPVPSQYEGGDGGTAQGRLAAKDPAIQTLPPSIIGCVRSRFAGGSILNMDMSQLELRIVAAQSGEPRFIDTFKEGRSIHMETACIIAGRQIDKDKDKLIYAAGKTLNFLIVYGGGQHAYQQSLRSKLGWDISLEDAAEHIKRFRDRCPVLAAWQERQLDLAQQQHYIEIPIVGLSRTFEGNVRDSYASEIANMATQAIAFFTIFSAQMALSRWMDDRGLQSLMCYNLHDAAVIDCFNDEERQAITERGLQIFRNPPFYRQLVEAGKLYDVPLDAETK